MNAGGGSPGKPRPLDRVLIRTKEALERTRSNLPIWAHKADIRWELRRSDILLLVGETGSGKSTQVPQFLITEPWFKKQEVTVKNDDGTDSKANVGGMIAITQPRRVAATTLAHRVAKEQGCHIGAGYMNEKDTVGYSVRFDTVMPKKAKIKFLTEGMLLQELLTDPHLRKYSAIIVDEIHERSCDVDILTGFLKGIAMGDKSGRGGVPLKLVIMSATANVEKLQAFFIPETKTNENALLNETKEKDSTRNGTNGSSGKNTVDSERRAKSRRASDVSYSSWDGISDEEPAEASQKSSNGGVASVNGHSKNKGKPADTESNSQDGVALHYIKGRQYPVTIQYTDKPVPDYTEAMLQTIFKIHTTEPLPGDILAFLTGQEEIETLQRRVEELAEKLNKALPKLKVVPLYGQLTTEQQQEAFTGKRDPRTRKVVLATNIAETSVTVPGVRHVIDSGKVKIKQFRSRLGLESLLVKPISKSSAIQRKGRAGREAAGKCYRLYTEAEYLQLPQADTPELLRSDMSEVVLRIKARHWDDVMNFPFMDRPDETLIFRALFSLLSLGALNDDGKINDVGKQMSKFPLPAQYARVLMAAADADNDCVLEAIDVISCFTGGDDVFAQVKTEEKREEVEETRRELTRREGDILTYLTTIQRYTSEQTNRKSWCEKRHINSRTMRQAIDIRRQLRSQCVNLKLLSSAPPSDPQPFTPMSPERAEILLRCFLVAFANKTAILQHDGTYLTTLGKNAVAIHPSSVLYGKKTECIMFLEHVYTQKNYAKKVSIVQSDWVQEAKEAAQKVVERGTA